MDGSLHHAGMLELLLLAAAPVTPVADREAATPPPCLPVPSGRSQPTPSGIADHRALRQAMGEPMPDAPRMVMLHAKGGHLATEEYSIIVARGGDGSWRGTAVGRSRIGIKDAPYHPLKRAEWVLDAAATRRLDDAISRTCPPESAAAAGSARPGPPPLGHIPEKMDVVVPGQPTRTFFASGDGAVIAALIRPPK